jgi:hypothetical protein
LDLLVDMEPEYSLAQMMRVLPTMQEGMRHIMIGDNPEVAAAAVVRIAVCHYLVRGHDRSGFLAELRHAAGLDPRRRRPTPSTSSVTAPGATGLVLHGHRRM